MRTTFVQHLENPMFFKVLIFILRKYYLKIYLIRINCYNDNTTFKYALNQLKFLTGRKLHDAYDCVD